MIEAKRKEALVLKVASFAQDVLTDKDQEILAKILTTEPMLKALGQVYAYAMNSHYEFRAVDFSVPEEQHKASAMQGHIQGCLRAIDILFQLITLPEETQDDSPDTDA